MNHQIIVSVLGYMCMLHMAALFPLLIYAFTFDHENILPFADAILVSFFLGLAFIRYERRHTQASLPRRQTHTQAHRYTIREAMAIMVLGWLLLVMLGALPYAFSNYFSLPEALFESAAALTTTGVSAYPSARPYPEGLMAWHLWSQWLGGIGAVMVYILLLGRLGSGAVNLFSAEMQGVSDERTLPRANKSITRLLSLYVVSTLVAAGFFMLGGLDAIMSIKVAMSTISTGGSLQLQQYLLERGNLFTETVMMIVMLIGSVNFVLYYKIFQRGFRPAANDSETKWYIGAVLLTGVCVALSLFLNGVYDAGTALRLGMFQVVSIASTTGLAGEDFSAWPSFCRLLLFYLAIIGGCSGSVAGGFKMSRLMIMLKVSWYEILRTLHPRLVRVIKMSGRTVPVESINGVVRYCFLYFITFGLLVILYALGDTGIDMETAMSTVLSCLSNLGAPYALLGEAVDYANLNLYQQGVLFCSMIAGRIELFALFMVVHRKFWLARRSW